MKPTITLDAKRALELAQAIVAEPEDLMNGYDDDEEYAIEIAGRDLADLIFTACERAGIDVR